LGSLRQWTDVGGQVTYAARYAPFGSLLWQQGTAPGPWGFAGEMQDPTGLIYLRARWYDPATGRFLTRDPFPGLVTLPSTQHPYVYVGNNPVNLTDPTGEFIVPLLVAAAIGGGLAAYNYFQAQPCATFPSALSDPAFQRAVGIGMLAGAVGGLIGFGVGAIGVGAFGGGLAGAIISGAVGGGLAGGAMEAVRQAATYGHIRNPQLLGAAMLGGVVTGGVFGAVGYGARQLAARAIMQRLTTSANASLGQNPGSARTVLTRPEYMAGQAKPAVARMQYGHAVERTVAETVGESPILSGLFKPVSGPGNPDFVGRSLFSGLEFDVTTNTSRSVAEHLGRPYGQGLILLLYTRPPGFTVFP
jgi:RHS repeat-associated protein